MAPQTAGDSGERRAGRASGQAGSVPSTPDRKPPDGASLVLRSTALDLLRLAYPAGLGLGMGLLLPFGGFVPVVRGWLDDRLNSWRDVVVAVGGIPPAGRVRDLDEDLGPVLARADAPDLFDAIAELSRRASGKPPGQVRLTYLPCCGVIHGGQGSRVLLVGLPLFAVLSTSEMRAVLAHELMHLARGDAQTAGRSARFVESLDLALDDPRTAGWGPLRWWALACRAAGVRLIAPLAHGRELRADRFAASVAGGDSAASALVKVALVQSIFREVLDFYDPGDGSGGAENLYAYFRKFWGRIPPESLTAMRRQTLSRPAEPDDLHPALVERLAVVQGYRGTAAADSGPALQWLGDPEHLERVLHGRLYRTQGIEPTVFHRAGS